MNSQPELIDLRNSEHYTTRTLRFICEKNDISIPKWPSRSQLISAIESYQKSVKKPQVKSKAVTQQNDEFYTTPIIPLSIESATQGAFPTPIVTSRQVPSQLPDQNMKLMEPLPKVSPSLSEGAAKRQYLKMRENKDNKLVISIITVASISLAAVIILFVFYN